MNLEEIELFKQFLIDFEEESLEPLVKKLADKPKLLAIYKERPLEIWKESYGPSIGFDIYNHLHPKGIVGNERDVSRQTSPSKVSIVLSSNMTLAEKEMMLTDMLDAKEKEIANQDKMLKKNDVEINRIRIDLDFHKGNLDARHIIETYEIDLPKTVKGSKVLLSRTEKWALHFETNPSILADLKKCDATITWPVKIAEIYSKLSTDIHRQTINIGNGRYLIAIQKHLPIHHSYFVKVIGKLMYGDALSVQVIDDQESA